MANSSDNAVIEPWPLLLDFAIHVLLGSLIFFLIALPAIGLNLFVTWLDEKTHITAGLVLGLTCAEWAVFIADAIMLVLFLTRALWNTVKRLWKWQ